MPSEEKFQAGESYGEARRGTSNFFADPEKVARDILTDYVNVRSDISLADLHKVLKTLTQKGEPLDDKQGTTELLIDILNHLPSGSNTRTQLTNKLIDTLWDNLQHPPLSYVGGDVKYDVVKTPEEAAKEEEAKAAYDTITFQVPDTDVKLREQVPQAPDGLFQYRMPDGSFNNILEPHLGKAGTPYAKTVRNVKRLQGVKPDPSLLFDLLMARTDESFKENPAGISSMLFYHASIIIHDIFRTSRTDQNKSDTSSYLDLAPLYGSSLKDQLEIRTMKGGKLKPDTFHEKRLLGQPAGVNVMLVLYSRFHNYVCDILLKINENGRFTLALDPSRTPAPTPEEKARALAKQDHDLFNVARLITGGLYVNICLHDYLRAITNTHSTKSDWTLDPRVAIEKQYDGEGVPRGVGNQVSVEFNLLYRFHSCISKKDEGWINNFFLKLFPDCKDASQLEKIGWDDLGKALLKFEASIPKDPSQRTFDQLVRQEDGTFKNEDLARVLSEAMKDPAGLFGARMVPKALRIVEILGINQARKWQVASLNEFREFFGLKRYNEFKEINSDENISKILEQLYTDPDMVELYPGLMIENTKPPRDAGCGICPTYTVGRAVLSDAITLVRSDRFNTLDYTVSNLTAWGYNEVQQDPKTLGGSMLYKLIQRGLPGWFPYNSISIMQPMYTKQANERIARRLGTIDQYTLIDDPKPPPKPVVLFSNQGIKTILGSPDKFVVPWLKPIQDVFPGGKKDLSWFMLAGDEPRNFQHREKVQKAMAAIPDLQKIVVNFISKVGSELIQKETFKLAEGLNQIDLIRDVAIPLNERLLGDLFYFDILTKDENPDGALKATNLYRSLLDIRNWCVNNNDPGQAWNRRRRAQEGAKVIIDSSRTIVNDVSAGHTSFKIFNAISNYAHGIGQIKKGSLRWCGLRLVEELLAQGESVERVVDTLWLTAFGGIGVPVTAFYEVLEFFLREQNQQIWKQVQDFAQKGDDASILKYVTEAQRLTSTQRNVRVAKAPAKVEDKDIKPGDLVVMMLGEAGRNPKDVADSTKFDPDRKNTADLVGPFSYGQHECFSKHIALAFITGLVKLAADLKQLRPAPGQMGLVKSIQVGTEKAYLNDSWSYLAFDASTWKLHFDGHGKGIFDGDREPTAPVAMQQYYAGLQKRKADIERGLEKRFKA